MEKIMHKGINDEEKDRYNFFLDYSSSVSIMDSEYDYSTCHTEIIGKLLAFNDETYPFKDQYLEVGRFDFTFINIDKFRAIFPSETLYAMTEVLGGAAEEVMEKFLDLENCWFNDEVLEYYDLHEKLADSNNVGIINRIEIIEGFRGLSLGKFIMNYLRNTFGFGCALFIGKVFPLQFESAVKSNISEEWNIKMNYKQLENIDHDIAFQKVMSFDKSCGFTSPFNNEYISMIPTPTY